jgi:hypothetical protein
MLNSILGLFTPDLQREPSPAVLQSISEAATWCSPPATIWQFTPQP